FQEGKMRRFTAAVLTMFALAGCGRPQDHRAGTGAQADNCTFGCAKGNEQGNGSDYVHVGDGSAWFLDASRTIKYCYILSPNFGASETRALQAVDTAFSRWSDYIAKKRVYSQQVLNAQLAINHSRLPACD